MQRLPLLSAFVIVLLVAAFLLACGSSHQLQSLAINPPAADAHNFTNGQVQFTAMGSYAVSMQSVSVNARWWSFTPWTTPPPQAAPTPPTYSLTSDGVAACQGVGTFTFWATAPADQTIQISMMTQSTKQLTATAQLTCP